MPNRDTMNKHDKELRSSQPAARDKKDKRPAIEQGATKDERQAEAESQADTVSKPGGFENDPDDPTNPNEVREDHLQKLRR